jgi:hypothetical protein
MCNPRRIRIRATAQLAEAWDQEVRRQVTLHGAAVGRAAMTESLSASLGIPVLSALDRVLDRLDGWQAHDDGYRYDVDGGYVYYHADTGDLEIVAEQRADVRAEGEASTMVRGAVEETLEAVGVGTYFDDGWGGHTEDTARRDAQVNADTELNRARAARLARARADAEGGASDAVQAQAQRNAQASLAGVTAATEAELEQLASQQLASVGALARAVFQQALALAYRDAILAYARSRQAEGVRLSSSDGVLDIEFEMEI